MADDIEFRLKEALNELTESHPLPNPVRPRMESETPGQHRVRPPWRDVKVLIVVAGVVVVIGVVIGLGIERTPAHQVTTSSTTSTNPRSQQVTVPNVIGMAQAAADRVLGAAGLSGGQISLQRSSQLPAGLVIAQIPPAGTLVAPRFLVSLVISSGSSGPTTVSVPPSGPYVVPNLVGMTTLGAVGALQEIGLTNSIDDLNCHGSIGPGHVVGQNPAAGFHAASDSRINLQISCNRLTPSNSTHP
jgi:beta-lactam-binding protein with PASTA domain